MRAVAALLRQFGTAASSGSPPNAPTIAAVDNGDGTATVAVSGSSAGSTNQLVYSYNHAAFTNGDSRTGDGDIDVDVSNGLYIFVITSTLDGEVAVADPALLFVAGRSDAVTVSVANALVSQLADGAFSQSFVPRLVFDNELELKNAGTLHVDVIMADVNADVESQTGVVYTVPIDVVVRQRFARNNDGDVPAADVNNLILLVEEVFEGLALARLSGHPAAAYSEVEIRALFVPKHLRELGQFTGIIRLTYEADKGLQQ